jgi:hypothetical protein
MDRMKTVLSLWILERHEHVELDKPERSKLFGNIRGKKRGREILHLRGRPIEIINARIVHLERGRFEGNQLALWKNPFLLTGKTGFHLS